MTDKQRLNFVAELIKLPTVSLHYFDDDVAAEQEHMLPGYTIRADDSCRRGMKINAPTLRKALDKAAREMAKSDPNW